MWCAGSPTQELNESTSHTAKPTSWFCSSISLSLIIYSVNHVAKPEQSLNFALFFFAYYGYVGIFSPYASLFFEERGLSAAQIGVLMSLLQVMRIFGPNVWGWVADHRSQRVAVLRVTSLAAVISFCGMFFGQTFAYFFAVMVIVNLFTSAQGPLSEALMLSAMRGDLTHYGRLRLWGSVGFIVSVMAAGQLLDWYGVELMPWLALIMLAMVSVVTLRMCEEVPIVHRSDSPSVMSVLRKREVWSFFTSTFLMVAAHSSLYVYYSLYLSQIGYSKTVIGLMWSLGVIAEIIFFFYQEPLFKRFGIKNLMFISLAIGVIRFLMIAFGAQSLVLLLIAQVLHAATFGVHHSSSVATLQRWFSGPLQARGQALFISISYGLGGTLGGLLLSACWDTFGAQLVYVIAALMSGFGLVAAVLSYRWQIRDGEIK
jgi:PPP family 3-phenylpropionic acid transporter